MADHKVPASTGTGQSEVDQFLKQVAALKTVQPAGVRGRLIFALDATMSREPTWDAACQVQAAMFDETAATGGLDVQLVYFRGFHEFHASGWAADARALGREMTGIDCRGGKTQIGRVLEQAIGEAKAHKIAALVYVGDCMEEDADRIAALAGELGLLGVRAFVFHEGRDRAAERTFREIARLTGGAYCPFDASSAQQLRDLLRAVAAYAAGGARALAELGRRAGGAALLIAQQVR